VTPALGLRSVVTLAVWAASGLIVWLQPLGSLSPQGHGVLGAFLAGLALIVLTPSDLPRGAGGLFMLGLVLLTGVKTRDTFSGFAGNALWTLVPALYFGHLLIKTGLGRRLALAFLRLFPTPRGMVFGWLLVGLVFSALTPSIMVRVSILFPIVGSMMHTLKLRPRSPESAFLSLLALFAATVPGNGWLTGSLNGPLIQGMLPPPFAQELTWFAYFRALFLPWMLVTALLLPYFLWVLRPHRLELSGLSLEAEYQKLGAPSRQERLTLGVLGLTFVAFLTTPFHGLPIPAIALLALFLFFALGLMKAGDIPVGISWDLVLFVGSMMSLPAIFSASGLTHFLEGLIHPWVAPVASSLPLFLLTTTLGLYAIRLLDAATGLATSAVLLSLTPWLSQEFGIPYLIVAAQAGALMTWSFLSYMSPFALVANTLVEYKGWSEGHLIKFGLAFIIATVLAFQGSIPYWRVIGLLGPPGG